MLPCTEKLTLQLFHTLLPELLWGSAYMERASKTENPNQELEKFWNLLKLLKSLWKVSFRYFIEWMLVGDEMPFSWCHGTKVFLGEMYSRDRKLLCVRFISPFCFTALSLMWAVSSVGSAPAHNTKHLFSDHCHPRERMSKAQQVIPHRGNKKHAPQF